MRHSSQYGLHTATEPIDIGAFRTAMETAVHPVVPDEYELDITVDNPWLNRFNDAWKWFALSVNYLAYIFLLVVIGLIMTRGITLIWEAWLHDLGN